jgi:hypothetical protein
MVELEQLVLLVFQAAQEIQEPQVQLVALEQLELEV